MKILFISLLFLTTPAFAVDLTILNNTGVPIRLTDFFNKCDGYLIPHDKPIELLPDNRVTFNNLTPVMHHYTVCGAGYCSSTAMPIRDDIHYKLEVVLIDGFLIDGRPIPDHWVGNINCPGE